MPIIAAQNVSFQAKKIIHPSQIRETKIQKAKRFISKHKAESAVLAAAAVAAIVAGGLIYKGKLFPELKIKAKGNEILKKSSAIEQEARTSAEYAQKIYQEACASIKAGRNEDFNFIIQNDKRINPLLRNSRTRVIEQQSPLQMLSRRTSFDIRTKKPVRIEEFIEGTSSKNIYYYDEKGFCYELLKGLEDLEGGTSHIDLAISYKRHWPLCASIKKDAVYEGNNLISAKSIYSFDYGKLNSYTKNRSLGINEEPKSSFEYFFKDDKVSSLTLNSGSKEEKTYKLNSKNKLTLENNESTDTQKEGRLIYFDERAAS
ncbi:MAG: hypothetical protein IJ877_04355 [Candidatus Gastranaerophilales bacterium]|nr:hypothetical protein [Candidatus Gastranaerophilales bacterium]